jgi:N-acylneuraminate cytidylyltransferase
MERTIYIGNDVNDVGCLQEVGYAVVPADAHPSAMAVADHVLTRNGGCGALRELADLLLPLLESNA